MKPIFLYPLEKGKDARISQKFGENKRDYSSFGWTAHNGVDFPENKGSPILAIGDGVVYSTYTEAKTKSNDPKAPANFIRIHHPNGYASVYIHMMPGGVLVKPGDKVVAGQKIGLVGTTGYSSGNHLHFTLKQIDSKGNTLNKDNGYNGAIDPLPFLEPAPLKPTASELPITMKPKLEQWQVDVVEFVKSKENATDFILKDVDGFIADPNPYRILSLVLHNNPVLSSQYAEFIANKHNLNQ